MSYRNPGNLNIGDPNAFLKAFLVVLKSMVRISNNKLKKKNEKKEI